MVEEYVLTDGYLSVRLELEPGPEGWSHAFLTQPCPLHLGAECTGRLLDRLIEGLTADHDPRIAWYGFVERPLWYIFTLGEGHCSLYIGYDERETLLYWLGREGTLVAQMRLSDTQLQSWLDLLVEARARLCWR
jgi:hypothetical protein